MLASVEDKKKYTMAGSEREKRNLEISPHRFTGASAGAIDIAQNIIRNAMPAIT
jgi:hypothetical protein